MFVIQTRNSILKSKMRIKFFSTFLVFYRNGIWKKTNILAGLVSPDWTHLGWLEVSRTPLASLGEFVKLPATLGASSPGLISLQVCLLWYPPWKRDISKNLKTAKVIPIFKAGDVDIFTNYRPVSIPSSFSKIYEKVMYNRLLDFIERFEILYSFQFGFRIKHSTNHALTHLVNKIATEIDQN
jgi:potassium voltage-gated channel Eag-related subfamily H protein 8